MILLELILMSDISEEKVKGKPLSDPFLQAVLLRFCHIAKTPVVSNLASYLRIQYFKNDMLLDYLVNKSDIIQCADIRFINSIGSEFHDQWKDFVECEDMGNDILMVKKTTETGQISKNSRIIVAPGQVAVIYDSGSILDATAEEGVYTFDKSTSTISPNSENIFELLVII